MSMQLRKYIIKQLIEEFGAFKYYHDYDGKIYKDVPKEVSLEADKQRRYYNRLSDKTLLEKYKEAVREDIREELIIDEP